MSVAYPAVAESVGPVRQQLAALAAAAGARDERVDDIRLAVSEAVTNVVRHAYPDGGAGVAHVTASVIDGCLHVLVSDDGCGLGCASSEQGLGAGQRIMAECADALSVRARASGGTEVQMRFDLVPARAMGRGGGRALPAARLRAA